MSREEVLAQVIEFAADAYGVDASEITEETNLNDLGVASSQRVAMSASLENEFDVMIPVARFGNFESVGAVVDFVMDEM
jgi:acyl carrier protein